MELFLKRGEELVGILRSCDTDFPWVNCTFEPTAAFDELQPLFEEELGLLDSDKMEEWQGVYDRILALDLKLIDRKDLQDIGDFLLHIRGNKAWFRY